MCTAIDSAFPKEYLYNERNRLGYSAEEITEEAVNDRMGEMLQDGKILDDFIEAHRADKSLLRRMWEAVKSIARKLTGAEKRYARTAEGKLRAALDAAAEAAEMDSNAEDPSPQMAEEASEYYHLVEDRDTLAFRNGQEYVTVYRAMQEINGELYPPMAAKIKGENGKTQLVEPTRLNDWYQADERPELVKDGKFTLNKGNGSSIAAAYNPYFHTSASPLNDHFSSAYNRPNLVVVEGVIPKSELTSGYRADGAKDSVGETKWHAGPVASKLKGDKARRVFLSRWFMAQRVVLDAEVAKVVANTLRGENVAVPSNVVTPSLLAELRKHGVRITEAAGKSDTDTRNARRIGGEHNGWTRDDGRRKESYDQFCKRWSERTPRTYSVGETAYAHRRAGKYDTSLSCEEAVRELKRLGIKCFPFLEMEINSRGYTEKVTSEGITISRSTVGINARAKVSGRELAGHEAYHVWVKSRPKDVADYTACLFDLINHDSPFFT